LRDDGHAAHDPRSDDSGSHRPPDDPFPAGAPGGHADDDVADRPETLRWNLWQLDRFVNAAAGDLPASAVVTARRITDVLRDVVDTSSLRPLDIYAVVSIQGIVGDYLPTTLRTYLALDPNVRTVPRPSGRTPAQSLTEQLEALLTASASILSSARDQDADALFTQGNFLRTKFAGSDLDL
jgi:hypothetical protein